MSKRKHDESAEPSAVPADRIDESEPRAKKPKKEKRDKKESKTKKKADNEAQDSGVMPEAVPRPVQIKSPSKQRRLAARALARGEALPPSVTLPLDADGRPMKPISAKKQKKAAKAAAVDAVASASPDAIGEGPEVDAEAEAEQTAAKAAEATKKNRFIVFIGNLPYTTTTAALETHFASVKPAAIRHITKPVSAATNPNGYPESKGYAFVEFEDYDRLKTCLRSFHRSEFTCGGKTRQMNVELTAGGGGKGEARKEKVRAKNEKLSEERKRRMVEEAKRKAERLEVNGEGEVVEKGANKAAKGSKGEKKGKKNGSSVTAEQPASGWGYEDKGGMHPSRLAMMNA